MAGAIYKETLEKVMKLEDSGMQVFIKSPEAFQRLELLQVETVDSKYFREYFKRDSESRKIYRKMKLGPSTEKITVDDILRNVG